MKRKIRLLESEHAKKAVSGAEWKVNTLGLIKELFNNPGTGALVIPFHIFQRILGEVAERAIELNDPELNALMCRLALFEQSDPYSKDYNGEFTERTIEKGYQLKQEKKCKSNNLSTSLNE